MPKVYNQHMDEVPDGAVFIGRPTKWGNPFVVGADGTRHRCVEKYRESLTEEFKDEIVRELKGRDLVCYCKPSACHGDVLLAIANGGHTIPKARQASKFTWATHHEDGYECSSAGDQRYSPLFARLPDGRTIEEHWQCDVKGWNKGGTNWRDYKGRPPRVPASPENMWQAYLHLWVTWAFHNRDKIAALRAAATGGVLTDRFSKGPINQAHALATILNRSK